MNAPSIASLEIVYVHGWAMGDWFWKPLMRQLLCDHVRSWSTEYFANSQPPDSASIPDTSWIGIGHSLGFRKLLDSDLSNCKALISVAGFFNFCGEGGNSEYVVKQMLKAVRSERIGVLKSFYQQCGMDREVVKPDSFDLLENDLTLLLPNERLNLGKIVQWKGVPVFAIAGQHDRIVPLELAKSQFQNLIVHPDAEHSLGWDQPEWCADQIVNCLKMI